MKKIVSIVSLFLVLLLAACNKKDTATSKTELLSSRSWSLTALVSDRDGNGTHETNDYAGYSACYKDNFHTFLSNGELEVNEGSTKCNPTDPQTIIKHWQLTNNETTLVVDTDNDLIELSNTTLKIKLNLSGGMNVLSTFTKR